MKQPSPEEIAAALTPAQREFLSRVCAGRRLGLADRAQDRVRQSSRKAGLVSVAKQPRRWVPTPLGLAVRAIISEASDEG